MRSNRRFGSIDSRRALCWFFRQSEVCVMCIYSLSSNVVVIYISATFASNLEYINTMELLDNFHPDQQAVQPTLRQLRSPPHCILKFLILPLAIQFPIMWSYIVLYKNIKYKAALYNSNDAFTLINMFWYFQNTLWRQINEQSSDRTTRLRFAHHHHHVPQCSCSSMCS